MSKHDLGSEMMKMFADAWASDDEKVDYLDTGYPPLNKIISGRYDGGWPTGRIAEMYGPPSSGKTAVATQILIAAQNKGGAGIFLDHEHSFSKELAASMGLNLKAPHFVHLKPDTWESANTAGLRFAQMIRESDQFADDCPIVMVLDSIAAAVPKSMFDKGIDEYTMNDTTALARVTSTTLKAVKAMVDKLKITAIYLNQTRTKPGVVYGDPTTTPGGSAMEFYADLRIALGRKKIMEQKEFIGQEITAQAKKNKFARPFQECEWRYMFRGNHGYFDVIGSMVEHLIGIGALKTSGAYVEWVDGKKYHRKPLMDKIESEGLWAELVGLLPK